MKKIKVELTQVGEKIIVQNDIKITVDEKNIEYKAKDIVDAILEKYKNIDYKVYIPDVMPRTIAIYVSYPTRENESFEWKTDYKDGVPALTSPAGKIKDYFEDLAGFVKEVEDKIFENHKVTNNYCWEF